MGFPTWLTKPTQGRITSGFGTRQAPTAGASTQHNGIDIAAPAGTAVLSALHGTVENVGFSQVRGNFITVNHGGGLTTTYQHLSGVNVAIGNVVRQGQRIGAVGSTGVSTGNHLHFGMQYHGRYVDPMTHKPGFDDMSGVRHGNFSGGGSSLSDFFNGDIAGLIRQHWVCICLGLVGLAILGKR